MLSRDFSHFDLGGGSLAQGRGLPGFSGRHCLGGFSPPLICRDRNKEASYPQSHGGEQGLEDLGGQMEEGVGIGYPSPRDADDGARVLRTLLGVGGTEGVLQQGWGDGRVQACLSNPSL